MPGFCAAGKAGKSATAPDIGPRAGAGRDAGRDGAGEACCGADAGAGVEGTQAREGTPLERLAPDGRVGKGSALRLPALPLAGDALAPLFTAFPQLREFCAVALFSLSTLLPPKEPPAFGAVAPGRLG